MLKQRHAWLLVFGVLFHGLDASAQKGPLAASEVAPFAGTWTLDVARSGVTDPERRVITVGPGWLRVELHRPGDDRPPVLIYNLDGSSNVNPFGAGTATTEIRREGNDILTLTVFTVNERPVTVQERLHVAATDEMTAMVTLRVEHGYEGVLPPLEKRSPNISETTKYFHKTR